MHRFLVKKSPYFGVFLVIFAKTARRHGDWSEDLSKSEGFANPHFCVLFRTFERALPEIEGFLSRKGPFWPFSGTLLSTF